MSSPEPAPSVTSTGVTATQPAMVFGISAAALSSVVVSVLQYLPSLTENQRNIAIIVSLLVINLGAALLTRAKVYAPATVEHIEDNWESVVDDLEKRLQDMAAQGFSLDALRDLVEHSLPGAVAAILGEHTSSVAASVGQSVGTQVADQVAEQVGAQVREQVGSLGATQAISVVAAPVLVDPPATGTWEVYPSEATAAQARFEASPLTAPNPLFAASSTPDSGAYRYS